MKLEEMYDTRKEHRRENGEMNLHHAVDSRNAALKGFWLMQGDKKLSGPYATREKAESFKSNRPDRIPASATIKEY